jgi:hypothetical protein
METVMLHHLNDLEEEKQAAQMVKWSSTVLNRSSAEGKRNADLNLVQTPV